MFVGVLCCVVVWYGVVWYGVVWCGMVWCGMYVQVGIAPEDVNAEVLPSHKRNQIIALQQDGKVKVLCVCVHACVHACVCVYIHVCTCVCD